MIEIEQDNSTHLINNYEMILTKLKDNKTVFIIVLLFILLGVMSILYYLNYINNLGDDKKNIEFSKNEMKNKLKDIFNNVLNINKFINITNKKKETNELWDINIDELHQNIKLSQEPNNIEEINKEIEKVSTKDLKLFQFKTEINKLDTMEKLKENKKDKKIEKEPFNNDDNLKVYKLGYIKKSNKEENINNQNEIDNNKKMYTKTNDLIIKLRKLKKI